MGEGTGISWAHHTFNPWIGCTKVSPGCDHCYAERDNGRFRWVDGWGPHGERKRTSAGNWREPLRWDARASMAGERRRVFCASLADVFDNQAPQAWRDDLWSLIQQTPNLDWMLLTKRPQNIDRMIAPAWQRSGYPPNVWLGTTVENQEEAARRIPALLFQRQACRVLFLSCEPLLGPLDLFPWLPLLDWIIVGGESGPQARVMMAAWAQSIRDQCAIVCRPLHFKQWGEWIDADQLRIARLGVPPGNLMNYADAADFAAALGYRRIAPHSSGVTMVHAGVKEAGRLLDGREHLDFPRVRHG